MPKKFVRSKVFHFSFLWGDDRNSDGGEGSYYGTYEAFAECCNVWQELWGFHYWNLIVTPLTDEEWIDFLRNVG